MRTTLALAFVVVVLSAALAQTPTPNLTSAYVWDGRRDFVWDADSRFWEGGDNFTWYVGFRGRVTDRAEARVGFVAFDNLGDEPIGGVGGSTSALRASNYKALCVQFKARLGRCERPAVALVFGADFRTSGVRGTNSSSGAFAWEKDAIFTLAVPLQWGTDADRTVWLLQPKVAWFDRRLATSVGGTIPGFGTVVGMGGGVVHRLGEDWWFVADVTAILDGDNSIDDLTNMVEDQVVWAAGVRWQPTDGTTIEAFATDATGPTGATSLIAAPDGSVGFGLRVCTEF